MAGGLERVYGTDEEKVWLRYIILGELPILYQNWSLSLWKQMLKNSLYPSNLLDYFI